MRYQYTNALASLEHLAKRVRMILINTNFSHLTLSCLGIEITERGFVAIRIIGTISILVS